MGSMSINRIAQQSIMHYNFFSKYVLRAPLLPVDFYKKLTEGKNITDESLKTVCEDPIVLEAIFLASPSLYDELLKWLRGEIKDTSYCERIMFSVLKYLSRMSSRCTPFGLFAGTAVGDFTMETNIELNSRNQNRRHTRLDMNFLVALSLDILKKKELRNQLLFYPNSSLYEAGHQFRYIEYTYVKSKRIHHIVGVTRSNYLEKVLVKARAGCLLKDLAEELVDDEISIEEATGFINELVESQLLISELEPSVSGPEFLDQILSVLSRLEHTDDLVFKLKTVQQALEDIDTKMGNEVEDYQRLIETLKQWGTDFEIKYMFQADMVLQPQKNTLSKSTLRALRKAMILLNKLTPPNRNTPLKNFKSGFEERFEEREMSLSKVLDVEIGIGFIQDQDSGDVSSLIDDLFFPDKQEPQDQLPWSPVLALLQKKLITCLNRQETTLQLQAADFDQFEENWDDLPDTMSTMIEIVRLDGEEKFLMSNVGGSSAANLLGRFCYGDNDLLNFTKEIITMETEMNPDKILAEIVHLPESRVGNILARPSFRDYEIPYLAKSLVPFESQLTLDDLVISSDRYSGIRLRSKKHQKEVLPRLTNAHNFSIQPLPIYQFLAHMQTQNLRKGIGFSWGPLEDQHPFLPRVVYENVILATAFWNISKEEITPLLNGMANDEVLLREMKIFTTARKIPQYVILIDGDNTLLINTQNSSSIKMLLSIVKRRKIFKLGEFLHTHSDLIKGDNAKYANQFILALYNAKKRNNLVEKK